MRFARSPLAALLAISAGAAQAASSWGFGDGTVSVTSRKGGDEAVTAKLSDKAPLEKPIALGGADTLKIGLTTKENGKGKKPDQAFLLLREVDSGLEAPFPLTVRENGKANVAVTHKDLPVQLLLSQKPLAASIVVASFGSAKGLITPLFDVAVRLDPNAPPPAYEPPPRFGKQPEIHHVFRPDPRSPPVVVTLVFLLAVVATVPALIVAFLYFGANLDHLGQALAAAPVSHAVFFGSMVAMEGVVFMHYGSWNLFQTLPAVSVVGAVMFLSGMRALGEVQSRRVAGKR